MGRYFNSMDDVKDIVRSIIAISKKLIRDLEKGGDIDLKAELLAIIRLDRHEFSILQKRHGDLRLIQACVSVLKTAQLALEDLGDLSKKEEVRDLIAKIIQIEKMESKLLEQSESASVEDRLKREWEPEVRRIIYNLIRKFSRITGLDVENYPDVELVVHHRYPSGKVSNKTKIPTCYFNGCITVNEDYMYDIEGYAEEIGHFFRDVYRPKTGRKEKLVSEFFGFLGRRIILEDNLKFKFGPKKDFLSEIKGLGKKSKERKEALEHYKGYEFASKIDLRKIQNWQKLFSLSDREVRMRFFRSDPLYEEIQS